MVDKPVYKKAGYFLGKAGYLGVPWDVALAG